MTRSAPRSLCRLVGRAVAVAGACVAVAAAPAAAADPDLVAAYGFDEGAGGAAFDATGNGNTGTIAGAGWTAAGRFGGALSFDGIDDLVTIADADALDLGTMTLEAWVRPSALGAKYRAVILKEAAASLVYGLYANTSRILPSYQLWLTDRLRGINGTSQLPVDAWTHLAATYDGAVMRLYVNGAQVSQLGRVGSVPVTSGPLRIGGTALASEYFAGIVDEVRVYRRALTASEITADMATAISPPDTSPPAPPAALTASGGPGQVSLSWSSAVDDRMVAGYNVHRATSPGFTPTDANRVAQPAGTSYTDAGLAVGTYHYVVTAVDGAGNVSAPSAEASATVVGDTSAPTVAVTAPPQGATASGTVSVTADAADDGGVAGVQFLLDGQPLGAEDTASPWSTPWNTASAANGTHELRARARDGAGNTTTSDPVTVTVENAPPLPPDGLVAAYGFEQGSGASVRDDSGNGHTGTISGARWESFGRFGSALAFDGVDDIVTIADAPLLDRTTAMTLEAWLRPSELGAKYRVAIIKEAATSLAYALYANVSAAKPSFQLHIADRLRGLNGPSQLPLDRWTHLAATYDGAAMRLYVDGTQVSSIGRSGSVTTTSGPLRLGGTLLSSEYFKGLMDEVRIYGRALTAAEIQADLNRPVSGDTAAPAVAATEPAAGAGDVSAASTIVATFSEAMDPRTISGETFQLRDAANALVPATVAFDPETARTTLKPAGPLEASTTYRATVRGGAAGVRDVAGNALAADHTWSFTTDVPPPPILLVTSPSNPFSSYAAEILRAEGLSAFAQTPLSSVDPAYLSGFDVAVLGDVALTDADVAMLSDWVAAGGNLIALRPDRKLAGLLGLADAGGTLSDAYLRVDTSAPPGAGIVSETVQFHGTADRYALAGARAVATLYDGATSATSNPAVTIRDVGTRGGQAAAFTFDLARSVVLTRQGNPAWAGQDRDGIFPIRANDLFYGNFASDPRPDWVDITKLAIPQADELQRLLANLLVEVNRDRTPLPRFWYLPRGERAAVVMTGDDHARGGTADRFEQYRAASPANCSVAAWQCVRGTSYVYPQSPLTNAQAAAYESDGFEVALHVNLTGGPCANFTPSTLDRAYTEQLAAFAAKYTAVPAPRTERTHCVAWSDWASQPKTKQRHGIRLDTNYYHYPAGWIGDRPGFLTGSGMVMRFADVDGTVLDVFQATTQMNDEASQPYPATVNALLDAAIGPAGYHGLFVANMHTDFASSPGSDAIVASAQARGVPVITARQALEWVQGRDASSFRSFAYAGGVLRFSVRAGGGAVGLEAMLPARAAAGALTSLTRDGAPVTPAVRVFKGVEYAVFPAQAGAYEARYGG